MARISFWGGVGVIGSSKVLIEQDGWRVLLDFGLDYTPGRGLFRLGIEPRTGVGDRLRDRLRAGGAPWLPRLYRREAVGDLPLEAGGDEHTAVFITHAHLDHVGLTGFIDPRIPIYAGEETARLVDVLAAHGEPLEGVQPTLIPMPAGVPVSVGPFKVTRHPVDHDVVGASGYAVETEDGLVAFTGDIRLHGRRGQESLDFMDAVHRARALVIEGTMLSAGFVTPERTEADVDQTFSEAVRRTPGLVLVSVYPRNIERVTAFARIAREAGRELLLPPLQAGFYTAFTGSSMGTWGSGDGSVPLAAIRSDPDHYVLQVGKDMWPLLLDLPLGPGSVFLHANGEPLGPFDPLWDLLQEWLRHLRTPFWPIGTGGHATPDDLNRLVERAAPDILFPIHSAEPDRLIPPPGVVRWLPQRGRAFDLSGRRERL
jgi:ribonuclease J